MPGDAGSVTRPHVDGEGAAPRARPGSRTREERTSDSRALILDAAVACLVEEGYAAATTLRVQTRAGVSRGRLLHHFPSRDELLVAAAQHLIASRMRAHFAGDDDRPDENAVLDRLDWAIEHIWASFSQAFFWASTELWTAARTNPSLARVLLPEERRLGSAIRVSMDQVYGARLAAHPRYPLVRDTLFTSMRGVALAYSFDPRDPRSDPHVAQWKELGRILLVDGE